MRYTDHYSLKKPQPAEQALVQNLNDNADAIDLLIYQGRRMTAKAYDSQRVEPYVVGERCIYENRYYKCVTQTSGNWDSSAWDETNVGDDILEAMQSGGTEVEANPTGTPSDTMHTVEIDGVIYAVGGDSANQNIADAFSELQTYAVGDYCIYESILYKCTTAVQTAGAWDSTKWASCVVTDEIGSGGGGGSSTLAGLDDVGITAPTDGQLLVYDDTNDEWVNGNIAGVNVQPDVYSTEERETGVWTDGKPLYQKTLIFTAPSSSSYTQQPLGISGYDSIIIDYTATFAKTAAASTTLGMYGNGTVYNDSFIGLLNIQSNTLDYKVGSSYYGATIYLTLLYTKTTDTPGSGTWTPSGVPAVHYSTDEQVVGTWIDGSTLYEKTIRFDAADLVNESNGKNLPVSIPNIDTVKYVDILINSTIPFPYYTSSNLYISGFYDTATNVFNFHFRYGSNVASDIPAYFNNSIMTIRYTKTSS